MRFKSKAVDGYTVYAVTGANVASFAIEHANADTKNLLGFSVRRAGAKWWMPGFKVFPSLIPHPTDKTRVTTDKHPVQSFVWDDFTCDPDTAYEYEFHPAKGTPKKLERGKPVRISIRTEKLFSNNDHDVFFNRGVASSQAYQRKFGNKRPDKLTPVAKRSEAWEWLSRSLDEALLAFIANAKKGDTLLGCFYEFHYLPVLEALKAASDRGVDLQLIVDAKKNEHTDKQGFHESFPRVVNLKAIQDVGFSMNDITKREARTNAIQHNKFMVLLKGANKKPTEVWTGSTNISESGIFGQTNVGHWTRDAGVAKQFAAYWKLLADDPGADGNTSAARAENAKFRQAVEVASPIRLDRVAKGTTPVFSPRTKLDVLRFYEGLVDDASHEACVTLAFGIGKGFKDRLRDNDPRNALVFMLLEKKDVPNKRSKQPFVAINAKNNVYKAWGSYIQSPLYQWTRETNARILGISNFVAYVHSKFLLKDPLGKDPIVVTGSANFSEASSTDNDENMLVIRGDQRIADIYFTEFNRLFNHYYFRSVLEDVRGKESKKQQEESLFLDESDGWLAKYQPGKIRAKRVKMFVEMEGISKTP